MPSVKVNFSEFPLFERDGVVLAHIDVSMWIAYFPDGTWELEDIFFEDTRGRRLAQLPHNDPLRFIISTQLDENHTVSEAVREAIDEAMACDSDADERRDFNMATEAA